MSDAEILQRLQRGDAAAFAEIYARYARRLFAYLARLTRSTAAAEDLLQETWMRFARRVRELRADTDVGAWLFTVARNLFLSEARHAMTSAARLRDRALWPAHAGGEPFELVATSQTQRRLEAALSALPIDQREVLTLVAIERLTPAQVAQVLGISQANVRKRLQRARAQLAAALNEGEPA